MLEDSLIACFEMYPFVLVTVIACASMDIYAAHIIIWRITRGFACMHINMGGFVYGCIVTTRYRHAFLCREASAKVTEAWAERIQCNTVWDDAVRVRLGWNSPRCAVEVGVVYLTVKTVFKRAFEMQVGVGLMRKKIISGQAR